MLIDEYVLKEYANLNGTDIVIWTYIVANKKQCSRMSIDELAKRCNVSRTTITRFVKKIGLRGYSEFKVLLDWENQGTKTDKINDNMFDTMCDSVIKYVEGQRNKNYDSICKLIYESNQTYVYGSGDIQNAVSEQIRRMFLSGQKIVHNISGVTFDNAFYSLVNREDVVILISLSGDNKEIVNIAQRLKLNGNKIISITDFKDSKLSQLSDDSLYISTTDFTILERHATFKTTMLYFLLIEFLFIKYSIYKRERQLLEVVEI
ncbi:RpiR family transcriptional regulator [Erysipelothrix larvae]|uniref:RpiR family transcriptional regulator n=1 Tax=Erysipelothrix larvae TaxID=1514105 RepID=A0A109UGR8_9FIRM|nr:MurR/RpiR family transcriptional regulator [Erysipelothrix larvae]AMC92998.1 RpiR family transcriptional regulator [Erysipelothrix larvae]